MSKVKSLKNTLSYYDADEGQFFFDGNEVIHYLSNMFSVGMGHLELPLKHFKIELKELKRLNKFQKQAVAAYVQKNLPDKEEEGRSWREEWDADEYWDDEDIDFDLGEDY